MAIPVGTANIQIKPSFQGFSKDVSRQLRQSMPGLGQEAGNTLGKAMGDGFTSGTSGIVKEAQDLSKKVANLKGEQEAASKKAKEATDKEAKAAGDLRIAQLKLQEAQESGNTKASQLASAEEKVAEALRKHDKAAEDAKASTDKLEKTTSELTEEQKKLEDATEKANKELQDTEGASKKAKKGLKGVDEESGKARKSMDKFGGYLKGGFAGIVAGFTVGAIVEGLGGIVTAASEAEQALGAVESVFKGGATEVKANADGAARSVGLSAADYNQMASVMGASLKNKGVPLEELAGQTDELIRMGADFAAQYGGTTQEAVDAISSALRGEMDPIEKYGIGLSQSALDAEALALGLDFTKGSMDATTKATATMSLMQKQGADAMGAFDREAGTFAQSQQVMGAQWVDLKQKMGEIFMPALATGFSWINTNVFPALENFIGLLKGTGDSASGFGTVFKSVFEGIGSFFTFVWQGVLKPVFDQFGAFFRDTLVPTIRSFYEDTIKPTWDNIVATVSRVWENSIKPIFMMLADFVVNTLVPTFLGFYRNTILPVMTGVGQIIAFAWNTVILPVFEALWWTLKNVIAPVFFWLLRNVVMPVFTLIGNFISFAWNNVVMPIFRAIQWVVQNVLGPVFKWLWENVLRPVFTLIGDLIVHVWKTFLKPTFDRIGDAWGGMVNGMKAFWNKHLKPVFEAVGSFIDKHVRPKFEKGVNLLKSIWESLKKAFATPINWVIDTVINKGIIGTFNKIAKDIGSDAHLNNVPLIALGDKNSKPANVKGTGGVTTNGRFYTGGYTGRGAKYEEAGVVHKDEFVIRKEAVGKLRKTVGLSALDYMNATGNLPGYFTGGLVRPVGGPLTSRFGASRGKYPHAGVDYAVPIGTLVKSALDGIIEKIGTNIVTGRTGKGMLVGHDNGMKTYYGHLNEFIAKVGQKVSAGQGIARSGNTGRSTGPHLHFETWKNGKAVNPLTGEGGLDTGYGDSPSSQWNLVTEAIKGFMGGVWNKATSFLGDNPMAKLVTGFGSKVGNSIIDMVPQLIGNVGDFFSATEGGIFDKNKGAKDQVKAVAKGYGWDKGDMWDALHALINKESSWNVNAANPTSSARGLFQKMTSLHGDVEKTAGDQAGWGLDYIKKRYGNPMNAWQFHQRNGSYATGGLVKPYKYDNGGWLQPGVQAVVNKTRKPEPILTNSQWQDISSIAQSRMVGGDVYNIEVPEPAFTAQELTETIQRTTRKNRRR